MARQRMIMIGSSAILALFLSVSHLPSAAYASDRFRSEAARSTEVLGRAEQALSVEPSEFQGVEFYPRNIGPRGAVSFARYGIPFGLDDDDEAVYQSLAIKPGFSPGEHSMSFGVVVQVQW